MYASALERQPDNLDARLGIVSSFVAEDNFIQARAGIDQILETNADNPRVWLFSGSFNLRVGEPETAKANFEVALKLASSQGDDSSRLQALTGLAESLLEQQEVDAARAHIDQLAVEAPNTLQTKMLVSRIAYIDEDWTTAQQNLQQILQVMPDYPPAMKLLGVVHMRSGNLSQAQMYLSSAVAAVPDDVNARRLLAETWLQLRNAYEAQEALAPIVSGTNADSMSLQMAARASLGRQDVDSALEFLRRNVEANPDNVDFRLQLALTLTQAGKTDQARSVLDEMDVSESADIAYRRDALSVLTAMRDRKPAIALEMAEQVAIAYSDRPGAFNLLGATQLAAGSLDAAKSSFEQAMKLEPSNIIARRSLAEIDELTGDLDSAKLRYQDILTDQPEAAWAMFALGRIAFGQDDYEAAVTNFRDASDAAPQNAEYRLHLAKAEMQLGKGTQASDILEDALEVSLTHIPSAVMLGMLKAADGDIAGALDIADQLQRRYPEAPAPYALEGEVHLLNKDLIRADSAYDEALSLGPDRGHTLRSHQIKRELGVAGAQEPLVNYLEVRPLDNEVRSILAESYMQTEDISKSIASYERVLSAEPENGVVLNNLAWAYYLVNDPRAIETAQKALDAMPDSGAILDTVGWIMVKQGSVEEGEKLLRRAVEMESGRPEIRYHHAAALAKLGRTDQARMILAELLSGGDGFASREDAEELLASL
jgi:Tfp pilus assembly protein PilF